MDFIYESGIACGFAYSGHVYLYVRNVLGDVVALLSCDTGQVVAEYVYDAWGNHAVLDPSGSAIADASHVGRLNPFRYRGYMYDEETGLYYLGSRYYDPVTCRFVSADLFSYLRHDVPNGMNPFAYCYNNPVNYTDRTGHFAITASVIFWAAIIGAGAGAVVGGAAGGITAAATGENVGLGAFLGALAGAVMGAGAGVGSVFIAPVIAGGTAVVAGHTLATGAAWGIGLGIGFTAGAVGGGAQEFFNQWSNSDRDISKVRFDQVGWSALENGAFNTLSTVLGGFGGTDLSRSISFILGAQLNVIPSGYTTITDIIKWYLQKEKTA